jgi:phosphate transport system substrate-binding protein
VKRQQLLFSPDTLLCPLRSISAEIIKIPTPLATTAWARYPEQKTVAIAPSDADPYIEPTIENVANGSYPISRPLYVYTPGQPTGPIKAYLDWILTEGQKEVKDLGFVPLKATE